TPDRGPYGKQVDKCVNYILAQAHPSGFINGPDTATHGPMYGHGFATMFLAECYGMSPRNDLRERIVKAVKLIADTQNEEGGWRYLPRRDQGADMSVTSCEVVALRAAKNAGIYVAPATIEAAAAYIHRGQNPDGGFMYMILGSDVAENPRASAFPRSAAAITALYALGFHETPQIAKGMDYLMEYIPEKENHRRIDYYYYGHYYAAQAFWFCGGERFARWFPAVRDELVAKQLADGHWPAAAEGAECATAMASIVLQIPNNCLPILQR
ncbi:MAG: prenyltransferase/squalene oxidase repeat-containing protein, partial [Thermoguttaceae bacterium]